MENTKYCQSCGMPLTESEALYGTNSDGSANHEYCIYCFKDGHFTADCSVEQMIAACVPYTLEAHPELSEEEVRKSLTEFLPMLKRWNSSKAAE